MSDTDSESEDKIRLTRRNVIVKSKLDESNSSAEESDNEGPSNRSSRSKRCKKLPSTDNDSDRSDVNAPQNRTKRRVVKPYLFDADDSSDTSWSPFDAAATAAGATVRTRPRSPRSMRAAAPLITSEPGPSSSPNKQVVVDEQSDGGTTSDTSDDAMEKCPICLHSFRDQEIGTPNVCEHNYCAPCIDEWSHSVQTCPIDRKPFTKIRVRACLDGAWVREIEVRAESGELKTDLDVTTCEICNLSDREDTMLLCDACDQGYHIECLVPPLTEIPEGSWYCDNCFGSDASDASEEDYAPLIEERDAEVGITETRLRIRRGTVPRITRTRQSERILATIMSRRVRAEDAPADFDRPGPSHMSATTASTTRRRTTMVNRRRTTRRRRTAGRSRTYVVEYDIDNFDKKFQIRTARKVVRRRRRFKRRIGSRRGRCGTAQRSNNENDEPISGISRSQRSVEANYPKLHLFGDKNALEYFPDDDSENDDGLDMLRGSEIRSGSGGTLVMSSARYAIGPNRNLLKRKGVGVRIPSATVTSGATGTTTTDLLSNIMDTMDKWQNMTKPKNLEKIKFGENGELILKDDEKKDDKPNGNSSGSGPNNSDIVNAPRGGAGNNRNINFRSGGSDFQNSNNESTGNNGGSFSIGGNGMNSTNNNSSAGYGYGRGNFTPGGNGGDFNEDLYHEPPRNRITTRRKSTLLPPPSLDDFPALAANADMTTSVDVDQASRNRITTRRKSTLLPPPSLDGFPALTDTSITSSPQNTPSDVGIQSGRIMLRRKSTLAPPPSFDEFPALSGMPAIIESGQYNELAQNQTADSPRNRIMTRRRSTLAPPPSLDNFPALFDPNLASTSENIESPLDGTGLPPRNRNRRKSTNPQQSSVSRPFDVEIPAEAYPQAPVSQFGGIFDDNPVIDYSSNRKPHKRHDYRAPHHPQAPTEFPGYNHGSQMRGNQAPTITPIAYDYSVSAITGNTSSTSYMPYGPMSGPVVSNTVPQPVPPPVQQTLSFKPYSSTPTMVPYPSTTPFPSETQPQQDMPIAEQQETQAVSEATSSENDKINESTDQAPEAAQNIIAPVEEPLLTPTPIDLNHKPTRITWKNSSLKKKSIFSNSDDEDRDDFQYSAESLEVAIKANDTDQPNSISDDKERETECTEHVENDEDLVQMDDDDDSNSEQKEASTTESNSDKPEATEELDQNSTAKKNILDLHDDSDWEELNDDKIEDNVTSEQNLQADNDDKPDQNENSSGSGPSKIDSPDEIAENENERSYTPCLDEQIHDPIDNAEDAERHQHHTPPLSEAPRQFRDTGIDNMDTELISDEDNEILQDEENNQKDGSKKSKRKRRASSKDRENDEEFRRISKSTRDRRYRDNRRGRSNRSGSRSRSASKKRTKTRSRSFSRPSRSKSPRSRSRQRSNSRQWSRGKRFNNNDNRNRRNLNQRFGRMAKRREIQRYNVRNVILERGSRNQKDQYGRDEARPPRSQSHSLTPPRRRSPTPTSMARRSRSASRSPYRRRRPSLDSRGSMRRSNTPPRQVARSPVRRSESPRFVRYSRSPQSGEAIGGGRSVSMSPKHRGGKSKRKKKTSSEKKSSKRRTKRRKTRDGSVSNVGSQIEEEMRQIRSRSKSWNVNRWSRSISPAPVHQPNVPVESWTPPLDETNEDIRISGNREKKRKRDKKKKSDKRRTEQRKEKRRARAEQQQVIASNRPSKEVFASGDNILVSVSFNKEKATAPQQQTTIVTLPPSKDQIQSKKQSERGKKSKDPSRKRKKLNVKPVAIIDLDNSPFKEMTPSPRAVIILSDSEHECNTEKEISIQNRDDLPVIINEIPQDNEIFEPEEEHVVAVATSPPASPTMDDDEFEIQSLGPKTPPEPRLIKFSLAKTKVRTVANPLHDAADDQNDIEMNEKEGGNPQPEATQTIQSPESNVPKSPDSGPDSPDVYDPFEPTKSPSPTPATLVNESAMQLEPARTETSSKTIDLTKSMFSSKVTTTIEIEDDPVEKENNTDVPQASPRKEKSDDAATAKTASIHVFSNILITPAKDNIVRSVAPPARTLTLFPQPANISPSKPAHSQPPKQSPMKFGQSLLSRLPLPPVTKTGKPSRHNGNDDDDGNSPYSPQSSDYDDLFDPPNASPSGASKKRGAFEDLFGGASPGHTSKTNSSKPTKRRAHKKGSIKEWLSVNKQSTQMGYGKLSNDQIRILEDIPASAVELQAKDKYLRKLNRQERVVEEVKLILKPHYNKKHITKEEYKDIMRRAVPKICHNPTGEINPKKIKNLIEAYVKKFRYRRKGVAVAAKPN